MLVSSARSPSFLATAARSDKSFMVLYGSPSLLRITSFIFFMHSITVCMG